MSGYSVYYDFVAVLSNPNKLEGLNHEFYLECQLFYQYDSSTPLYNAFSISFLRNIV